jgi:release factor glutamine methyltransferase
MVGRMSSMSLSISDALAHAKRTLAGAPSRDSDAEELVSRVLAIGRGDLVLHAGRAIDDDTRRRLDRWLERRLAGEPVQYITGRAAFRDLDLAVDRRVLIPRPETEGLVEAVLVTLAQESTRWPSPRVLDLGTGSGAIALAVAQECPRAVVTASDASAQALEVARANGESHGLEARVRFVHGDWFDALDADERFEVVASNPPYIATGEWDALPDEVRRYEPQEALFSGASGLDALREIIDRAPEHLVAGGLLAVELAEARAEEVAGWLDGARDWSAVELRDDLAGYPRVLLARREHGPAIAPAQWGEER